MSCEQTRMKIGSEEAETFRGVPPMWQMRGKWQGGKGRLKTRIRGNEDMKKECIFVTRETSFRCQWNVRWKVILTCVQMGWWVADWVFAMKKNRQDAWARKKLSLEFQHHAHRLLYDSCCEESWIEWRKVDGVKFEMRFKWKRLDQWDWERTLTYGNRGWEYELLTFLPKFMLSSSNFKWTLLQKQQQLLLFELEWRDYIIKLDIIQINCHCKHCL